MADEPTRPARTSLSAPGGTQGRTRESADQIARERDALGAEAERLTHELEAVSAEMVLRLEDAEQRARVAEQRAEKAELVRDRATKGTQSFQKMVEQAQGRALQNELAAQQATARAELAERTAAECTHQAHEALRLAAHADRELAEALSAGVGSPHADELAALAQELSRLTAESAALRDELSLAQALIAEADADRERLFHLSDARRLRELEQRAEQLWPATPERVDDYDAWLAEAEGLVLMLEDHRLSRASIDLLMELLAGDDPDASWTLRPGAWEALAAHVEGDESSPHGGDLRARILELPGDPASAGSAPAAASSLPANPVDLPADGPRSWTAVDLLWWRDELDDLVRGIERLARPGSGLIADMAHRAEVGLTMDDLTLSGAVASRAWQALRAELADARLCPAYGGLALTPQRGLLPIGRDPRSGLAEFAMPHTGRAPERDSQGRLVLEQDSALVLVLIPGGRALLGSQSDDRQAPHHDPHAKRNEAPVHRVELAPYFLSKYAMTQGQWERFTGTNPSRYPPTTRLAGQQHDLRHPVENVSWTDCDTVATRLGLSLPTEGQWEYAARGGSTTPWWTGERRESLVGAVNLADAAAARGGAAWAAIQDWPELDDGYTVHAPVDFGRPNAFGLHGIHGNVWEWCRDTFGDYDDSTAEADGARQTPDLDARVFRGGGFRNTASQSRSASRMGDAPDKRSSDLGVRFARPVDQDVDEHVS